MEWNQNGSDQDIEDRRDDSGGGGGGFGGFGGPGFGGSGFGGIHLGIGGVLVVGVLSLLFHQNLFSVFSGGGSPDAGPASGPVTGPTTNAPYRSPVSPGGGEGNSAQDAQERPEYQFIRFVLNDVQSTWDKILPQQTNHAYRHAKLLLYRGEYPSACGEAQIAIGPFYCPGDQKVYLDLGFMNELKTRFGAPGQFAQAYVVAHELGHHVQYLLGIEQKVRREQLQNSREQNPLSVRLELQADCFAGVWANSAEQRGVVKPGEIQDGLRAAAAVGDDRLQKMATGRVDPDSFTHGTSQQRDTWLSRGLQSGLVANCNTFGSSQ